MWLFEVSFLFYDFEAYILAIVKNICIFKFIAF